jgi:hypothetical protein
MTFIPFTDVERTIEFMRYKEYPVYGFLLSGNEDHSISSLVRNQWDILHYATGKNLLLFLFQKPERLSEDYINFWRNDEAVKAAFRNDEYDWNEWSIGVTQGLAYDYREAFSPPIERSDFPCLALITKVDDRNAVVQKIPAWNNEGLLYSYLMKLFDDIDRYCDQRRDINHMSRGIDNIRDRYMRDIDHRRRNIDRNTDHMRDLEFLRESLTNPNTFAARRGLRNAIDTALGNQARIYEFILNRLLEIASGYIWPSRPLH